MKKLLVIIFCLMGYAAMAQSPQFKVSVGKQSKIVTLDGTEQAYTIKKAQIKGGSVIIKAINPKVDVANNRSFMLVDENDAELYRLDNVKATNIITLKTLAAKIETGKTYKLYTMAIPKDPKKAAVVRVRRILVCSITVL